MQFGQRAFLHRQVCLDVVVNRSWALMPEPKRDHADIDAGLQRSNAALRQCEPTVLQVTVRLTRHGA